MSAKEATVLTKSQTQSEDALQSQVSKKKLLSVEAQHISHILESCVSKVEFAAALPAYIQLNRVSGVANKELSKTLEEHQILNERLERLEEESNGEQEGEVWEARTRVRAQLEVDIKNSVRDLLRLVRRDPDGIFGLRAEQDIEVGKSEYILIKVLEKFHSHMVEKLGTSLDEEHQQVLYEGKSTSPATSLEQVILKEESVITAIEAVEEKISQANHDISTLQGKIAQERGMSPLAQRQSQSQSKTSDVRQSSIQQDIDRVNIQLNNMILKNRQRERSLQEKNEKVETEIEYLLQNFDDEIEENQANLELNEIDYEREKEEMRMLEKPFSVLEVECNQILERRRVAEEKRQEEMRELELKTKAAVFAQAWWRGYSTRKALKNKGKSKKAKKGKGKKSK